MLAGLGNTTKGVQKLGKYKKATGVIRSDSNEENEMEIYDEGDQIILRQGERHRLIGLDDHCVVAEIWQHTDANQPSDEGDIIRVYVVK